MASHVVEAFLGYAIETGRDLLRDDCGDILVSKAPLDMASSCEVVHQPLQGDRQAEVIENGGQAEWMVEIFQRLDAQLPEPV